MEHPYLIALALIEQNGKRTLPLGGKSIAQALPQNYCPRKESTDLVQQLLLRIFQKTDVTNVKRANGDQSLLLIQVPLSLMQERIPLLKAEWINTGNSKKLFSELQIICEGIWAVRFLKGEGVIISKLL